MMSKCMTVASVAAVVLASASGVQADTIIDLVQIGNPGNLGEWSGESYGGFGPDRVCGAVGYGYNIGKYEITAGQYTEFLNAVAATDTYGLYNSYMADTDPGVNGFGCNIQRSGSSGSYTYSVAGDWADRPVNYVSWRDTLRFANWLHNGQPTGAQDPSTTEDGAYDMSLGSAVERKESWQWALTTEDEWYKAVFHKNDGATSNYFDYPTSSDSLPSNDLIDPDPGNNANFYRGGYTIGSPYWRTESGEFENSDSPYGTFDQGGNVWEWNEAVIGSSRGARGGSFYDGDFGLHAAYRNFEYTTHEHNYVGFRVAQVPEPTALSLLLLGGIVAVKRRR